MNASFKVWKALETGSDSSRTAQTAELQAKSGLSDLVFSAEVVCCDVGIQLKMNQLGIY